MASKLKTQEVILQSPNGLVEKTLKLNDDGSVSIDAPIKQQGYYIVDSGSSENGNWIKFSDGTLIMTKDLVGFGNFTGALSTVRWTFPTPFINSSYSIQTTALDYGATWFWVNIGKQSDLVDVNLGGTRNNYTAASVMAIGRWK